MTRSRCTINDVILSSGSTNGYVEYIKALRHEPKYTNRLYSTTRCRPICFLVCLYIGAELSSFCCILLLYEGKASER